MKISNLFGLGLAAAALVLTVSLDSNVYAQGRGNSRGGGNSGGSRPPATSPGIDRGIDMSGTRSNGRADTGRGTASTRSNGRSDNGMETARNAGSNRRSNIPSDNELNRYRGISKKLGTTPETLRLSYEAALAANPGLKFGQFVSANVVASNLAGRFPNVTAEAILLGLQNDRSLGQTLRDLGVNSDAAKQAEKDAKRQIKESQDRD